MLCYGTYTKSREIHIFKPSRIYASGEIYHFPIRLYSQRQYLSLNCLHMKYTLIQLDFDLEVLCIIQITFTKTIMVYASAASNALHSCLSDISFSTKLLLRLHMKSRVRRRALH